MNYKTLHENYIILSKLSMVDYLKNEKVWNDLITYLTPYIKPIKGIHSVTANQNIIGQGSIKLSRLTWKNDSLIKIVENYNSCSIKENFTFSNFYGYFPNLTTCHKANSTPQVTLIINDSLGTDKDFFGSGFFLSFREDYFEEYGEQEILNTINNISHLLKSVLRIKLKKAYAKPYLGGWTDSLQDIFPTTSANVKNGTLVISKEFKKWQEF